MRLLLTTTLLASVVAPTFPAFAQSAVNPADASDASVFDASTTPALRGTEVLIQDQSASSSSVSTPRQDPLSGRTIYPVRPVSPVGPVTPVSPVEPLQGPGGRSNQSQNPYDPVGLQIGSFLLYPALSIFAEATDNIDNSSVGSDGRIGRIELELDLQSQWSRHELNVGAKAGLTGYDEPKRKPDNEQSIDGSLRLDLADQTTVTLNGSASKQRESANNVELLASGGTQASVQTQLEAGAVLEHGAGIVQLQLRGSLAREQYAEDKSRNFDTRTFGGRVGIEATDQVIPFVDVELAQKRYRDGSSTENGDSLRGSIGIEVVNREKLSGEISVGAIQWRPSNNAQKDDAVLFADASVTWSPNPLWTLQGGLQTGLTSTSTSATSVATHTVNVSADFAARQDLELRAAASLSKETYRGGNRRDWVFDASLSAEYSLNRNVVLIGRIGHESRDSNVSGSDYKANSIELGVKIQR